MLIITNTNYNFNKFNFNFLYSPMISSLAFKSSFKSLYFANKLIIRTMMSGKCMQVARAAYYVASTISNSSYNDSNFKESLIRDLVGNAIDHNRGISPHHTALWKHLSHSKSPGEYYYESFKDQIPKSAQIVKYEPHVSTDFRTLNEISALKNYIEAYGSNLSWVYATLDARPATFHKANQTNPDFWVYIDKGLGIKHQRCTYQDEKSGMDMFRHSTRGSVGTVYFDQNGKNIQTTSQPITMENLIIHHQKNLKKLQTALNEDGLILDNSNPSEDIFFKAKNIISSMPGKSFNQIQALHNQLQDLLWEGFQANPQYNRSISFIFLKEVIYFPMTEKEAVFSYIFHSNLRDNYLYNLDRKSDFREIYTAFIRAGKKIDPYFVDKLYHLHTQGITLTHDVLTILKETVKNATN